MIVVPADQRISPVSQRAAVFVDARRSAALALGRELASVADDPDAFVAVLRRGLTALADPEYLEGQRRVAPGIGPILGVRWPLIEAVNRGFALATRGDGMAGWLFVADRLLRDDLLEARWIAFGLLERLIAPDPERAWQLVRRASAQADDWITVDSLAHVVARGVLNEPYRWAELEQLVYAPSPWERRLVGSTIATIPFADRRRGRDPGVAMRALPILGQLMGDAEPAVQKALAWALRSLVLVDVEAVAAFCEAEAETARRMRDGHRAWVVREALSKLEPARAARLRDLLDGIRRVPGSPSTSAAADVAARFGGGLLGRRLPEPPLS